MFNVNNIHYHHQQLEMTNKEEHEIALLHSANLQKMLLFTVKNSIPLPAQISSAHSVSSKSCFLGHSIFH